ncbi:MAG: V-type ATP synthase subunit F [Euryarchaeota archaeon]|nr:V-type ATP synthase subunit F [Euryarchaeota archaeon]
MEIAVVGREEFVTGFRLAGVRKVREVPGDDIAGMERVMEELMKDREVGILVVMDADFRRISPALRKAMVESVEPVVIAIGKIEEVDLRERIRNVVGVDLWK